MPQLPGLVKGLGVTFKTMLAGAVTVQYPHVKGGATPARPRRDRAEGGELHGLHALRPPVPRLVHLHRGPQGEGGPSARGGKPRTNALDRFDIDYALCMYCGICVEVCPFDALFWTPEYEYSEPRIADLLHDKERLGEWMQTVPEPLPLEVGAAKKK